MQEVARSVSDLQKTLQTERQIDRQSCGHTDSIVSMDLDKTR